MQKPHLLLCSTFWVVEQLFWEECYIINHKSLLYTIIFVMFFMKVVQVQVVEVEMGVVGAGLDMNTL